MSDQVAPPPMAPGWHQDGSGVIRRWDGTQWVEQSLSIAAYVISVVGVALLVYLAFIQANFNELEQHKAEFSSRKKRFELHLDWIALAVGAALIGFGVLIIVKRRYFARWIADNQRSTFGESFKPTGQQPWAMPGVGAFAILMGSLVVFISLSHSLR